MIVVNRDKMFVMAMAMSMVDNDGSKQHLAMEHQHATLATYMPVMSLGRPTTAVEHGLLKAALRKMIDFSVAKSLEDDWELTLGAGSDER